MINDIDVHFCTHLFFSYVGIDEYASIQIDYSHEDIENNEPKDIEHNGLKEFNNLQKRSPKLKTLVAMQVVYDESTINNNFI